MTQINRYKCFWYSIFFLVALGCNSCATSKEVASYDIVCKNKLLGSAVEYWLGAPYMYGGNDKSGIDCSGMVLQIYKSVYKKDLYRSSIDILNKNCRKIKFSSLEEGDLVFFATSPASKDVNHVGVFLYDDKFIHASSSKGVVISSLTNSYYVRTFKSAGRVK